MNQKSYKISGSGITKRWLVASMLLTVVILIVASVAIMLSIRQSYYSLARQAIDFRIRSTMSQLPSSNLTGAERVDAMRGLVEDFTEKEKFEFMLVDSSGKVVVTSSGFSYNSEEPMDDYFSAQTGSDGEGVYIGNSASGEHIIAVTRLLTSPIGEAAAIRFVSSLRSTDAQIMRVAQLVVLVCLAIIGFVAFSGFYFIRSIVIPIGEIGATAKQIASGDFNVRIENKYNDEIGELSAIINDMAAGLGDADRMKNEFISSVSHELRTPLTSIKGWAETLSQIGAADEDNLDKGMGIIINETDRLSVLVEDLLDFSRLRSASLTLNCAPFDLTAELSAAVQTVEQRVKSLRLGISLETPEEHIVMDGDRNRIRQVFTNILDNAIKYTPPFGTIEVKATLEGAVASIATTDSGAGIPEQDLPLISTRFYKASNSVTGSGIGLAVVKDIISLHGGELEFESELGHGTTVTVRLPVERKSPAEDEGASDIDAQAQTEGDSEPQIEAIQNIKEKDGKEGVL